MEEEITSKFADSHAAYDWCYDNEINIAHKINKYGDMVITLKMSGDSEHGKVSISVKRGKIAEAATLLYAEGLHAGLLVQDEKR